MTGGARDVVLVHSSDLHVDDEDRKGPGNGNRGLRAVLRLAEAVGADVVLLAGDTFDNGRVSLPVVRETGEILAAARVPVVMLPGNHDPLLPNCIFRRAGIADLAHVHVFGLSAPEVAVFETHGLEIRGRAHTSYDDMHPLPEARPREARWQVVMAHGHYVPPEDWTEQSHRSWRMSDEDLAGTEADYIALGHWDRPTPAGDGRVAAYYSGSPEMARTANVVRLRASGAVEVERVALRWE